MPEYLLEPVDLLFFRDARPMAPGQGSGHGCRAPLPNTLHEALRAALLDLWGHRPAPDAHSRNNFTKRLSSTPTQVANGAFQSLQIRGPFFHGARDRQPDETDTDWLRVPEIHKKPDLRLPLPLDVLQADSNKLVVLQLAANPNAAPLSMLPVPPTAPSKDIPKGFWTPSQFAAYLRGDQKADFRPLPAGCLFEPEYRVGVEIDNATFTAREGQLYTATYFRPARSTRFWFAAEIADRRRTDEIRLLAQLDTLLFGGDRRMARLEQVHTSPQLDSNTLPMPDFVALDTTGVKWTLLTPAIFVNGWLPGWIDPDTFNVKLRLLDRAERVARRKTRRNGETFNLETDSARPVHAKLVSVCLDRPQPVTGWDVANQNPKPSQLAVPAGSSFYFQCQTPQDAAALAGALHLRTRSDALGEKSYGLGVCGVWKTFESSPDVSNPDKSKH